MNVTDCAEWPTLWFNNGRCLASHTTQLIFIMEIIVLDLGWTPEDLCCSLDLFVVD